MLKALVVVDIQNDFVTGSLGSNEATKIIPNVIEKIKNFNGMCIATYDTHYEDYLSSQEGKMLPVKHCVKGENGFELVCTVELELMGKENYLKFEKPTFGSTELADFLRYTNSITPIDEITLVGLCTDICVVSNAMLLKAFLPETKIVVDSSCCAGTTIENHNKALDVMKCCQIHVI